MKIWCITAAFLLLFGAAVGTTAAGAAYCGVSSAGQGVSFLSNMTFTPSSATGGSFFVDVVGSGINCNASGLYEYIAVNQSYSFSESQSGSCAYDIGLTLQYAFAASGVPGNAVVLVATAQGETWTLTLFSSLCHGTIPDDVYCGNALGTAATIYVENPRTFNLDIGGSVPCQITGEYLYDAANGAVLPAVITSTCTQYLAITNVTYEALTVPTLVLHGSVYDIPFQAVASPSQCIPHAL